MIYVIQILKMLNEEQFKLFTIIFNDLSHEIETLGYDGMEDELMSDLLFNHFGLTMESRDQLKMFTEYILKHQNNLEQSICGIGLILGRDVA